MNVADAQRQVRCMYLGGLIGQLVSAAIWICSAAFASQHSLKAGIIALVVGGFFIFPITQLVLKLSGRPAALPAENPLKELAIEVAVIAPLMLPLAGAAALYRIDWFYPAMMIAVGAHYLPFAFLYGMRHFIVLAVMMIVTGLLIGIYAPHLSILSAWATAAMLVIAAFVGFHAWRKEDVQLSDVG